MGEKSEAGETLRARVVGDLRACWRDLLIADLAYGLLGVAVVAPLVALGLRVSLATSGRSVAADQDIARFLLSPVGLVALSLGAAVLIATVGLQVACLLTIGWARARGGQVGAAAALGYGLRRARPVLSLSFRLFLRCALYLLPLLLLAGGLYVAFLRRYDINYYLQTRPPEFLGSLAAVGVVALVLAVLAGRKILDWVLALPLLLFEGVSARDALTESEGRSLGDRRAVLRALLGWLVAWALTGALVTGLVGLLTGWLVPHFEHRLTLLAVVIGLATALTTLVNVALGFFQVSTFALLLARVYERLGEPRGGYPPFEKLLVGDRRGGLFEWLRVRLSLRSLLGVLLGLVALSAGVVLVSLRGVSTVDDVEITAHRGASGAAPENTMAAVEEALVQGADWVEIDVQETAEGEVVVLHDSDLMKNAGVDLKIWNATRADLDGIDIGSWFDARFANERVPRLVDVLEACRGRARVVIELKYYGHDQRLEERVIEIVEAAGMVDSVRLMSLDYDAVRKIKQMRPDWTVGLLTARALGDLTRLEADFLAVNTSIATPGFVDRAHQHGKQVLAWTVNAPAAMSAMISRGVDGLITDEPALARRVLEQRREMTSVERLLVDLGFVLDSLDEEASGEEDA